MPLIPAPTTITSPNLSSSGRRARCPTLACACSIERSSVCATTLFLDRRILLNGFPDDFGDVLHLDRIAAFRVQLAVFEIGDAVGTGRGQDLRSGVQRLRQAQVGEALALGRFHPDAPASPSAAEAVVARLGHLAQREAGYLLQRFARLLV